MSNRRLALGTLTSGVVNVVKIFLQFMTLPLIASLVGPADYGLFGLAMPTVTLMLMLTDSGLGISLAREPESNVDAWSTATWFLLGTGCLLAAFIIVWSIVQAALVHQPRLSAIMTALSVCPILLALTVPASARLTRQARLGTASLADLAGNVLGAAAAITLALLGAGPWSMVAQTVLFWVCRATITNLAAPLRPQFRFVPKYLRPHLQVGGWILGGKLLDTGGRTAEASLIARWLGADFVGAYTFANQVPRYLCEAVGSALWAMLYAYAIRTENRSSSLSVYWLAMRIYAFIVFPCVAIVSVQARPLVDTLLGSRWDSAITMLQILVVTQAFNSAGALGMSLLYATGRARIPFRIDLESACCRLAAVMAEPWIGFSGIALGLGLVDILMFFRRIFAVNRAMEGRPSTMVASLAAPVAASAAAAFFCWLLEFYQFDPIGIPAFGAVVVHMAAGFVLYAVLVGLLERQRIVDDVKIAYKLIRA
jgi:O-antigen/teichoic acid export membrane protein